MALSNNIKQERNKIQDSFSNLGATPTNTQVKSDPFTIEPRQVPQATDTQSALDKAISRTESVIAGEDPFTQQLMARERQTAGAREAAARASQRQQLEQAGFDEAFQATAAQQQARDLETARARQAGEMALSLGRRQDAAVGQLAQLERQKFDVTQTERQNAIENWNVTAAGSDLTNPDNVVNLTQQGKQLFGEQFTMDQAVKNAYSEKARVAGVSATENLITNFGPGTGNELFYREWGGLGGEVLNPNLDVETKKNLTDWYSAETQGQDQLFDDDGDLTESGELWLKNKNAEINRTELQKSMNEARADAELLFGDDQEKLDHYLSSINDLAEMSLGGADVSFSSGALDDLFMFDKDTGEAISIAEGYKSAGIDDELGEYALSDNDELLLSDGSTYTLDKSGNVLLDGAKYEGTDAGRIKAAIEGKDYEPGIKAPGDVKTGEFYEQDGETYIKTADGPVLYDKNRLDNATATQVIDDYLDAGETLGLSKATEEQQQRLTDVVNYINNVGLDTLDKTLIDKITGSDKLHRMVAEKLGDSSIGRAGGDGSSPGGRKTLSGIPALGGYMVKDGQIFEVTGSVTDMNYEGKGRPGGDVKKVYKNHAGQYVEIKNASTGETFYLVSVMDADRATFRIKDTGIEESKIIFVRS